MYEHRRAHMRVGLLDTSSCTYKQAQGTRGGTLNLGDTRPCVWIKAPWRRTHMQTHSEQPHLSSSYSQLETFFLV